MQITIGQRIVAAVIAHQLGISADHAMKHSFGDSNSIHPGNRWAKRCSRARSRRLAFRRVCVALSAHNS